MTQNGSPPDVGPLEKVRRRRTGRTLKRATQIGAAVVVFALAGRQSLEWGINPLNFGVQNGRATSNGLLAYEAIGALLGFFVGSWVVVGRIGRREVLMFNNAAMFHRVEDRTVTSTSHYDTQAMSRGGLTWVRPPTISQLGGGRYGWLRRGIDVDRFLVTERVLLAKINGAQMAYKQSDGSEPNSCIQLRDSDGNSLALPIIHPFRKSLEWGKIVSDALKSNGVNYDARVGAALDGWINHQ